jgi:uncharacterized delta-60 repeat protein
MKSILRTTTILVLLLALPAAAKAKPGELDRSFGRGGRVVVRAEKPKTYLSFPERSSVMAPGAGGLTAVAAGKRVFMLIDGRPARVFGDNGSVTLATPPDTRFFPAGVAIDSQGRVLVAGTVESPAPPRQPFTLPAPSPASAAVYRFLADGSPDPNFGSGGALFTQFGQEPSPELRGGPDFTGGPGPSATVAVKLSGLVVDQADRPVVVGTSAKEAVPCNYLQAGSEFPDVGYVTRSFVARLTASGSPDPSFASGGVLTDPQREDPQAPALTADGELVYAYPTERRCPRVAEGKAPAVSVLSADGGSARHLLSRPDGGLEILSVRSLAVDRRNRILVLIAADNGEGGGSSQEIRRLLPDGRPDPSFGTGGTIRPRIPAHGWLAALTTDERNRVLLAGSVPRRAGRAFLLARVSAAGRLQRSFGGDGFAEAGFGRGAKALPDQVYSDDRGRIVVGGTVRAKRLPNGYGLALARCLGR